MLPFLCLESLRDNIRIRDIRMEARPPTRRGTVNEPNHTAGLDITTRISLDYWVCSGFPAIISLDNEVGAY